MNSSAIETPPMDVNAIATCMEQMAVQMTVTAGTLRDSALFALVGTPLAEKVVQMEDRAREIHSITEGFRISGDLRAFDMACTLAGWSPENPSLARLRTLH